MKTKNNILFALHYKNSNYDCWHFHGFYNKTDVLGTANNLIKIRYLVKIIPTNFTKGDFVNEK